MKNELNTETAIMELLKQQRQQHLAAKFPNVVPLCNGRKCAQLLGVSEAYISSVRRAMGTHATWLDPAVIRQWILDHPEFRTTDVYPVKPKRA